LESSNKCHSALHEAAIVAIMMVLPAGTDIYDRLQCLPTQIREVVADGIRHGAAGALTEAYLRLCHRTNLRAVTPGFLTADEIPGDVDVRRLIAEFSDYAEAIIAAVDVEHVIKDAPL
jgi:hypothetical protein